jgi:hypothetical protein
MSDAREPVVLPHTERWASIDQEIKLGGDFFRFPPSEDGREFWLLIRGERTYLAYSTAGDLIHGYEVDTQHFLSLPKRGSITIREIMERLLERYDEDYRAGYRSGGWLQQFIERRQEFMARASAPPP